MAVYTFKHAFVGKANQAAGTAAAHIRYITRKSATHAIVSEGMPRHRHAAQRFMDEREAAIRKNGRVCDKFIIAVPREMDQEQAIGALRRFGNSISTRWDSDQDRLLKASYFLTLQDWDTPNPHCHFVFVDSDRQTGERVFGTTRKGSTERLRAAWEEACNGEMERLGIEARIDRRPQHVIEAELAAVVADDTNVARTEDELSEEIGQLNEVYDEAVQLPAPPNAPTDELEPSPESEDHSVDVHEMVEGDHSGDVTEMVAEDDMAREPTLDDVHRDLVQSMSEDEKALATEPPGRIVAGPPRAAVHERVKAAYQLGRQAQQAKSHHQMLMNAVAWREHAAASASKAETAADRLALRRLDYAINHTQGGAGPAGMQLPSWSFLPKVIRGWQSPARRAALEAKAEVDRVEAEHRRIAEQAQEDARNAAQWKKHNEIIAKPVPGYSDLSPAQQREALAEMELAAEQIEDTVRGELDGLSPADIYEAWQQGLVEQDEAIEALRAMGANAYAESIAREAGQEQDVGPDV